MRRFLPLMVTGMLLCIAFAGFSDILIMYTSGESSVDLFGDGNWKDAEVDMELKMQTAIRTGSDGAVEIDLDGELVSIGANRYASVGELLGKIEQKKRVGFLKGLKKYTSQMGSGGEEYTEMALAGVRGAAQDEAELEWFDESDFESEGLSLKDGYNEGMQHYNRGEYTAAIDIFSALADEYGADALGGELAYHLGLSLFHVMRFDEAARYLETAIQDKNTSFYGVALMHLSVSRYFMRDYTEAIEGFVFLTEGSNAEEMRPYALLMLGKCYREKGEPDTANGYFTMVKNDYGGTEFSDTADEELRSMGRH